MANLAGKRQSDSQAGARIAESTEAQLKDLPLPDLESRLGFSVDGLSQAEAQRHLDQYGYNELPEKKVNPVLKFLSYFWGPIPGMIIVAAILSGVLRHWPDLGVIPALLLMNAVVGFREEHVSYSRFGETSGVQNLQ